MEDLDAGGRLGGRTRWLVLVAVVLLVGAGLLRLTGPEPRVQPGAGSPSGASVRPSRTLWPPNGEIGSGTLYVLADGEVHRIDVASGRMGSTGVRLDAIDTRLTPVRGGVLVWLASGGGRRLVGPGEAQTRSVPKELRSGEAFLAGEGGQVWTASRPSRSGARTTWRLVDRDGRVATEVRVSGRAAPDGAGGLLDVGEDGFRPVYPRPPGPFVAGELLASGPDGYLSRSCTDDGRCSARIHDPATGEARAVGLAPTTEANPGALSPGNRFVTLGARGEPAGAVQVREVDSPQVLESFMEDGPIGGSATWLSDRWVALVSSNGGIVLYDAVGDEAISPDLPLRTTVQQLVLSRP